MDQIHNDILSSSYIEKCPYAIQKNIILSICGIDKLSISGIEKSIFVYIAYGNFSIYDEDKISLCI